MNHKLTVVMYHYVRDFQKTQYTHIKGLDVREFEQQISYLNRNYNIISLDEVIECIEQGKSLPSKSVVLTFDDGYVDHIQYAVPILNKFKIKGAFYIPAKAIEEKTVLDVNKIHFILALSTDINNLLAILKRKLQSHKLEYNLKEFEFYYSKLAIANRFDTKDIVFIKRLLQVELEESLRNKITNELFIEAVNMDESDFSSELYLTKKHLKEMSTSGMHIGCHGYEHYWWDHLSDEQLNNDLDKSLKFLQDIGRTEDYWTACYPYGSYSHNAVEILENKKCALAFTTEVAVADLQYNHRLLLPRLDTNDLPKTSLSPVNDWYNKG